MVKCIAALSAELLLVIFSRGRGEGDDKTAGTGNIRHAVVFSVTALLTAALIFALRPVVPLYLPLSAISLLCAYLSDPFTGAADILFFATLIAFSEVPRGGAPSVETFLFELLPTAFLLAFFTGSRGKHCLVRKLLAYLALMVMCGFVFVFPASGDAGQGCVLPSLGMVLNLLLTVFLVFYDKSVLADKENAKYEEKGDPEYSLLIEIKKRDPGEYAMAVHRALLCEKVADSFGIDTLQCKLLGYYQTAHFSLGISYEDYVSRLQREKFPGEVIRKLRTLTWDEEGKLMPPQDLCLLLPVLAGEVIGCVKEQYSGDADYTDRVVDFVFRERENAGFFDNCEITIGELKRLKDCFKKEKEFYDILC